MSSNPKPLAPEKTALWRVMAMADATGTDLVAAYEDGRLSDDVWAETVTRCRGCRWAEGCDQWLASGDGADRPVPEACRNSHTFRGLLQD